MSNVGQRTGAAQGVSKSSSFEDLHAAWYQRYRVVLPLTLVAVILETAVWRRFQTLFCGMLCRATAERQTLYANIAHEMLARGVKDYAQFPQLNSPAGVLYLYAGLQAVLGRLARTGLGDWLPVGLFCYVLCAVSYLMRRCRVPAAFLFFMVVPVGTLLQGHALLFVLPETAALGCLVTALAAILAGHYRVSVGALAVAVVFDVATVFPVLPALSLCLLRALGGRRSVLWSGVAGVFFLLVSVPFLLANPRAYLLQALDLRQRAVSWNPVLWLLEWLEQSYDLPGVTSPALHAIARCMWTRTALQTLLQFLWINYRWLRADGGIAGLLGKLLASQRGRGIRPTPWTPRETLTVVFEALLLSTLVRFPSLVHLDAFPLLSVLLSCFFCIALSFPLPRPAIFGLFAGIAYPLSFLYRRPLADAIAANLQFHVHLPRQLHFLPLVLLPVAQLIILVGVRRDMALQSRSAVSSAAHFRSLHAKDHRRSLSQTRPPIKLD